MIARELLEEARAQIDAGDLAAANDYIDAARAAVDGALHEERLNITLAAANAAEDEVHGFVKWRALLAYGVANKGGTPAQRRLLQLLQTAPAHDPTAPLASKKRTDFFAWASTHRAEIHRLQKSIVNQLEP
jgi:hypothetical protein